MLKIYIANLGKYNEGELVGKWVELPCEDLDEVLKEIEVVDGTAYEEYAIRYQICRLYRQNFKYIIHKK